MKLHRSYKHNRPLKFHPPLLRIGLIFLFIVLVSTNVWLVQQVVISRAKSRQAALAWSYSQTAYARQITSSRTDTKPKPPTTPPPPANQPISGSPTNDTWLLIFSHQNITTTIFGVGEEANSDNGYIANDASAWDGQWQTHFGGVDSLTNRNGYLPAGFTPKENPFYFALPYSDATDQGNRKPTAHNCPGSAIPALLNYSWCKNTWIAIRHGNLIVYAQWEDTGPFETDDVAYVFGNAAAKNRTGARAGLDVSPAVRDYLKLNDVDKSDWVFVPVNQVPPGPWTKIITSSKGDTINN